METDIEQLLVRYYLNMTSGWVESESEREAREEEARQ